MYRTEVRFMGSVGNCSFLLLFFPFCLCYFLSFCKLFLGFVFSFLHPVFTYLLPFSLPHLYLLPKLRIRGDEPPPPPKCLSLKIFSRHRIKNRIFDGHTQSRSRTQHCSATFRAAEEVNLSRTWAIGHLRSVF
jgi:hypothetical protein